MHVALVLAWLGALSIVPFPHSAVNGASAGTPSTSDSLLPSCCGYGVLTLLHCCAVFVPHAPGSSSLLLRHVSSGAVCFDLFTLVSKYLTSRFPGNATAMALYSCLLPDRDAKLAFLVQLVNGCDGASLDGLFSPPAARTPALLKQWLKSADEYEALLRQCAQRAVMEVRGCAPAMPGVGCVVNCGGCPPNPLQGRAKDAERFEQLFLAK